MKGKNIVFPKAYEAVLEEQDFDISNINPNSVAIKTQYSIVSAGTEGALYKGTETWAKHPISPGYGAVGQVVTVGDNIHGFQEGDHIFTYGNHATYSKESRMMIKLPEDIDSKSAVFARMAQVSFTALRLSESILGDYVAVIGQGLVGNIAAQLFVNSGCTVIAIDVVDQRLQLAKQCGIDHTINASEEDVIEKVKELTQGRMCSTVVEASGIPNQSLTAAKIAGRKGEVILLGTPRGEYTQDTTDLLRNIHLWSSGCITFKGAREWRFPDKISPNNEYKTSLEGNLMNYFDLVKKGKLIIEPLISHIAEPENCSAIYQQLHDKNQDFMGVLFNWN